MANEYFRREVVAIKAAVNPKPSLWFLSEEKATTARLLS
jgi:hypothetical protein